MLYSVCPDGDDIVSDIIAGVCWFFQGQEVSGCVRYVRAQFKAQVYGTTSSAAQVRPPSVDPLAPITRQKIQLQALVFWEQTNSPEELARRQKEWERVKAAVEGDAEAAKKQLSEDEKAGY